MNLSALPFHVGPSEAPLNPDNLPDTFPFGLRFDRSRGALMQRESAALFELLDRGYQSGVLIGTPLNDDAWGRPYADDFLGFITRHSPTKGRTLEIGAGIGYLTQRLSELGYAAVGIEPGRGYAPHHLERGVEIVQDFFPSSQVQGRFDLICSYAVLEHAYDPVQFLLDVKSQLTPNGRALFSVPDCTAEIADGDPGMLMHEHISYFDAGSLVRLIESVGLNAYVTTSGYGRCLYAVAAFEVLPAVQGEALTPLAVLEAYPHACSAFIARCSGAITRLLAEGSVGIYCPSRGLALFDPAWPLRFFDDDPSLLGKFLPPFQHRIENRNGLLETPVDNLVILSRTFGRSIRVGLRADGCHGRILTIDDIAGEVREKGL